MFVLGVRSYTCSGFLLQVVGCATWVLVFFPTSFWGGAIENVSQLSEQNCWIVERSNFKRMENICMDLYMGKCERFFRLNLVGSVRIIDVIPKSGTTVNL